MLARSLCCFRGISTAAERRLWRAGCLTWDHIPRIRHALSPHKVTDLSKQMPELRAALSGRVADYFIKRLPLGHRMRIWPDFAAGVAFMDIETTGLGKDDVLTVIGLWQAGRMFNFVRGQNLSEFLNILRKIEVLVTFNGIRFDWPVVAQSFGLTCSPPHIDLMHEIRVFGYAGGLKKIERILGIKRAPDEDGDGAGAAFLWRRHLAAPADKTNLARLLKYNAADVRALLLLSRLILKRSFDGYMAPLPDLPPAPYNFHSSSLTNKS